MSETLVAPQAASIYGARPPAAEQTFKGVSLQPCPGWEGMQVTIEEHSATSPAGSAGRFPRSNVRYHDLGIYERESAQRIKARLMQRFATPGEPLSAADLTYLKQSIQDGTL